MIGTAALSYTGDYRHDLDSNRVSGTGENAGSRLTSTFDSATGTTTSYTYKPNTNYIQTETSTTSTSSVVSNYSYMYRADGLKTGATETTSSPSGATVLPVEL